MNRSENIRKSKTKCQFSIIILTVLFLFSCQSVSHLEENSNNDTLYQQFGGQAAVKLVIKRMVTRLHRDEKLTELFVDVDDNELRTNLEDFVCKISDGGCEYHGADMIDIHTEMLITKAEFDHFVTLFIYSMQDENIAFPAQNKLLARLAALRDQVIEL